MLNERLDFKNVRIEHVLQAINGVSLKGKSQQETFSLIKESGKTAKITIVRDNIDEQQQATTMTSSKVDHPVNRNPSNSLEDELEKSGVRISKR